MPIVRFVLGMKKAPEGGAWAIAFLMPCLAFAADYPTPKQGHWIARDFKFHTGELMPGLKLHYTKVLAINSAGDERNPPETGLMEAAMKRVKIGKLYLIPASEQTSGHLTTANAKFYKRQLEDLLRSVPPGSY